MPGDQEHSETKHSHQKTVEGKSCFVVLSPRNRQLAGFLGCIFLLVGVFMPLITIPFTGTVSYMANSQSRGMIIFAVGIVSGFWVFQKKYRLLYYTSMGSFLLIGSNFMYFQNKTSGVYRAIDRRLDENTVREITETALGTIRLDYGWAFLGLGALLLLIAAAANDNVRH